MKKPIYKRVWFWVLIVLVVGGVATAGGEDKKETSTPEVATNTVEQDTKEEVEQTVEYKMNENVNVGDMTYKVSKKTIKKSVGPDFLATKAKDTFVVLNITVKNNGKEAVMVDSNFFKILEGDVEYEADGAASISANSKSDGSDSTSFFLNKINPGVSMSGKVVFDVPSSLAKSKNTKLQVQTGAWGTEKELINLYK